MTTTKKKIPSSTRGLQTSTMSYTGRFCSSVSHQRKIYRILEETVFIFLFRQGITCLLPWDILITVTGYWKYKLSDDPDEDVTQDLNRQECDITRKENSYKNVISVVRRTTFPTWASPRASQAVLYTSPTPWWGRSSACTTRLSFHW